MRPPYLLASPNLYEPPSSAYVEAPLLEWVASPRAVDDALDRGVLEIDLASGPSTTVHGQLVDLTVNAGLQVDLAAVGGGALPLGEKVEAPVGVAAIVEGSAGHDGTVEIAGGDVTACVREENSRTFARGDL